MVSGAVAEVITGTEEAALSFIGAVGELEDAAAPFVVVDLGGGSTEVVVEATTVTASFSADIGCVRLTERCLHRTRRRAAEIEGGPRRGARRTVARRCGRCPSRALGRG